MIFIPIDSYLRLIQRQKEKKEQKQRATEMFSNDFSMTLSGVKKQISFPSSNSQSSGIFVGDIPDNFLNKVAKGARSAAHGNVHDKDSLEELVKYFQSNEDFTFELLYDHGIGDEKYVSAVSFHDRLLAPPDANSLAVLVSDVTFSITPSASGFSKWSFLSNLTPGHEIELVLASGKFVEKFNPMLFIFIRFCCFNILNRFY